MQNSLVLTLVLAASSTVAIAQSPDPAATQSQPAPVVRTNPNSNNPYAPAPYNPGANNPGYTAPAARPITNSQPIPGVLLRVEPGTSVQTVSANAKGTELRVERGVANVNVHHPNANVEILVDLPGGQTTLLKDGLYTFNADTNTVRVLKGEAEVYPSATSSAKPIKIKEAHQLNFTASAKGLRSVEVNNPGELTADLLPNSDGSPRGGGGYPARGYGYGPYGDGYGYGYPYPYYPYGWGYGYPYYGYGLGFGFGYYGGFRGYRGGFGGFRGRR